MKRGFTILMVLLLCVCSSIISFALMPGRNGNTQNSETQNFNISGSEEGGQEKDLRYNSTLRINPETDRQGRPSYQSITSISTLWPSNYSGYHYHITNSSYTISADRKTCTVKITGVPKNADGMTLTGILYDTVTFSAN